MRKLNEKGAVRFEVVTVLLLVIVLLVFFTYKILNSNQSPKKFNVMISNARSFGKSAYSYNMDIQKDKIYLLEMKSIGDLDISDSFNPKNNCDLYESKVEFEGVDSIITLACGEYLIDSTSLEDKDFKVYKVSEWSTNKTNSDDEMMTGYTYGKLDRYYNEDDFIEAFNDVTGNDYTTINAIGDAYEITTNVVYRTKTLAYSEVDGTK